MKKKVLAVLLSLAMGISLIGCGSGSAGQDKQSGNTDAAVETGTDDTAKVEDTQGTDAAENVEESGGAAGSSEGAGLPSGSKIGFSTLTLAAEFFSVLDESVHEYLERDGYEVVTLSCEGNAATQVSDIENLISMNCDAILLFPNHV